MISFELYKMMPYLVVVPTAAVIGLYFAIKLIVYLYRACTHTARSLAHRSNPPTNTTNPDNATNNNSQNNTSSSDLTPPITATHTKPSRAATLEAQRRAIINNSAIKRNQVAPNTQDSPTPLARTDPNARFSAPRSPPKVAQNPAIVRKFADDNSSSEGKSEDGDSGSEDTISSDEEKMDIENVV